MSHGHVDPTVLHISVTKQPTATSTSHVNAEYVPETNIPTKLDTRAIYAK